MNRYATLEDFYRARGGLRSGERQYGVNHYSATEAQLPAWRRQRWTVAVVRETGDVYAWNPRSDEVHLLGTLPVEGADVPRTIPWGTPYPQVYARADAAFAECQENPEPGRSLAWFVEQIAQLLTTRD